MERVRTAKKRTSNSYRSGLEEQIAEQLDTLKVPFRYETETIRYTRPAKLHRYTPDFILTKKDGRPMYIESKGRFLTSDKLKSILVKDQFPEIDLRFVFSNSKQRISKKSKTTYAMWCHKHGFKYADKFIPKEWIKEVMSCS